MNFLVVGNGSMGKRRVKHLEKLGFEKIFCFDIRRDRMDEVKSIYNVKCLRNIDEIAAISVDGIFICVPPSEHKFYLDLAVDNRWNFMVEQPIAFDLGHVKGLKKNVEEKQIITHVSNNFSFNDDIKNIKKIVRDNVLGKVLSGIVEVGEWLPNWHTYEPYQDYYPSKKSLGGGLDAICDISWISDIFGKVSKILCLANKKTNLEIDTDDIVQIILDYNNGPQIMIHSDMIQQPSSHKVKFICEKGNMIWNYKNSCVEIIYGDSGKKEKIESTKNNIGLGIMQGKTDWGWVEKMYFMDTNYFIKKLKNKNTDIVSLENGIYYLSIIKNALKASETNTVWIEK
jgi:predicted dehydrogenase